MDLKYYLKFTNGHYHHPFHRIVGWRGEYVSGKEHPRTCIEMEMCALSGAIREKPDWWNKMRSPEIKGKWTAEVKSQQESLPEGRQLSDEMVCSNVT